MHPSTPPQVTAVEVVAAQPTEADRATIAQLNRESGRALPEVAYLVKLRFKTMPPVTSQGWALYVGSLRIPKYWGYRHGIYFKVFDPQFLADHKGKKLRFSQNATDFIDTNMELTAPSAPPKAKGKAARLPLQAVVLK
jgi:hypothetical protein